MSSRSAELSISLSSKIIFFFSNFFIKFIINVFPKIYFQCQMELIHSVHWALVNVHSLKHRSQVIYVIWIFEGKHRHLLPLQQVLIIHRPCIHRQMDSAVPIAKAISQMHHKFKVKIWFVFCPSIRIDWIYFRIVWKIPFGKIRLKINSERANCMCKFTCKASGHQYMVIR